MQQRTSEKHPHSLACIEQLRAELDPITPIFVLVDPMLGEPLPIDGMDAAGMDRQFQLEALWQRSVTRIELHKNVPLPPSKHPYLVGLRGISDPCLEETLVMAHAERAAMLVDGLNGEGGAAHRIGGWLQSSMQLPQLAATLSTLCLVNTEARTSATYLRMVDRRVLALLRYVVGDDRVAGQFGRLQRWVYLDMQGQLATVQSAHEHATTLRLNRDEWEHMEQGEALHRVITQWLGEAAKAGESGHYRDSAQQLYASARKAVEAAKKAASRWPHRFTHPLDEVTWAALTLLHPLLDSNETVHALLAQSGTVDDPPEPVRYLHSEISSAAALGLRGQIA